MQSRGTLTAAAVALLFSLGTARGQHASGASATVRYGASLAPPEVLRAVSQSPAPGARLPETARMAGSPAAAVDDYVLQDEMGTDSLGPATAVSPADVQGPGDELAESYREVRMLEKRLKELNSEQDRILRRLHELTVIVR